MTAKPAFIESETSTAPKQFARNGFYNDEQIVEAARTAMQITHLKLTGARVQLLVRNEAETSRPSSIARLFLDSLFRNVPLQGPARTVEQFSDEAVGAAAKSGFATGEISMTFVDKNGVEKPTGVIDDFLLCLLRPAQ